ncbi:SUF system NifU family Fe-S cluster assembly protein [bacterium]|nr:SUF system NifU family Fe-S cluster assembly protein [bacterium]
MSSEELYQELIIDHYKNPRSYGVLDTPDAECSLLNPLCGDEITVTMSADGKAIESIRFSGKGCSISQASASMMTELCRGRSCEEALERLNLFSKMMKKEITEKELEELGDAAALQGVAKFAARIKCAMLPWDALAQCIKKVHQKVSP